MKLWTILSGSFALLAKDPKLFIPRIITTILYTVYTLYTASLTARVLSGVYPSTDILLQVFLLLALTPLLYVIDILSYAMYPRLVEDRLNKSKTDLVFALKNALKSYKTVVVFAALIFVFTMVSSLVITPVFLYAMATSNTLLLVLASLTVFFALIVFSILVFFVVPSSVISGRGVIASFKESVSLGVKHRWDLLKLNIMFSILALATLYFVFTSELLQHTNTLAILSFVFVRLVQAVIYTYLCVANPLAYLNVRN